LAKHRSAAAIAIDSLLSPIAQFTNEDTSIQRRYWSHGRNEKEKVEVRREKNEIVATEPVIKNKQAESGEQVE
jgi:hypothetical protein